MSICVPFILAMPGVFWAEWPRIWTRPRKPIPDGACGLGTMIYLIAAVILWVKCINIFDRLNGRPREE